MEENIEKNSFINNQENNNNREQTNNNEFNDFDHEVPHVTKEELNKSTDDINNNQFNTEEHFQEFIKGEEYVNILIVDQKSGVYNTIQKAIDAAVPYTTIKIKPGIYRESLVISTPFLDLESENPNEQAIVISTNKPTLRVEGLKNKESIRIANLKLTNRGIFSLEQNEDFTKL
jgi:flagellar hook-basal body complex protein FliE